MTPSTSSAAPRWYGRRHVRGLLAFLLIATSLFFLVRMLLPDAALIRSSLAETHWAQIVVALLAAAAMYLIQAVYHLGVLGAFRDERMSVRSLLPVYLQAQIVRYLPGRVWGVVYQAHRMASVHRPGEVVVANVWQMVMTNLLAVGVVGSTILAFHYSHAWLLLVLPFLLFVELLHRRPAVVTRVMAWLRRWLPGSILSGEETLRPMPFRGTCLLVVEWMLYLLAFAALLYGRTGLADSMLIGTWYAGATLLSLIAFVVPAGIAVREAIFVAAPTLAGADPALLAVIAALARLVFVAAEVGVALVAGLLLSGARREDR